MNTEGGGGFRRRRRGPGGPSEAPGGLGEHKRSLIETGLLIALLEESRHGYALIERVDQLVGGQVYVDPGSVYRILRLLEQAGVVSSTWEAGTSGPQRRTYTVEPSGRDLLRSWAGILAQRGSALVDLSELAQERLA